MSLTLRCTTGLSGSSCGPQIAEQLGELSSTQLQSLVPELNNIAGSALDFQGTWNASTNAPALINGTGTSGQFYVVNVAGARDLGSGSINWGIGDWVIYDGVLGIWEHIDNPSAEPPITDGDPTHFWDGSKTFRRLSYATDIDNKPTLGTASSVNTGGSAGQILPNASNILGNTILKSDAGGGQVSLISAPNQVLISDGTSSQIFTNQNTAFNKNFGTTAGTVYDAGAVTTALAGKENIILSGTATHFYAGDKTFKQVDYSNLSNTPTLGTASSKNTALTAGSVPENEFALVSTQFVRVGTTGLESTAIDKTTVGLSNVDNTADANKPISLATQTALDGKANTVHSHVIADVTGLQTELDGKAPSVHSHVIGDVTGLQTALDGKIESTEKGAVNGVATLDGTGKIPSGQLPTIRITDVHVVADLVARDALVVDEGDVAKVSSNNSTYIWDGSAWVEIDSADAVTSVNGNTGVVVLDKTDIGLSNVDNTSDANKPISLATQTALDGKAASVHTHDGTDIVSGLVAKERIQTLINDGATAVDTTWSSDKINTELTSKLNQQSLETQITFNNFRDLVGDIVAVPQTTWVVNSQKIIVGDVLYSLAQSGINGNINATLKSLIMSHDISDPFTPVKIAEHVIDIDSSSYLGNSRRGPVLRGKYIVDNQQYGKTFLVDISKPGVLNQVIVVNPPDPNSLCSDVWGRYLIIYCNNDLIYKYDLYDPSPVLVQTSGAIGVTGDNKLTKGLVIGDYMWIWNEATTPIKIVRLSDLTVVNTISSYNTYTLLSAGSFVYLGREGAGTITQLDNTDPENPTFAQDFTGLGTTRIQAMSIFGNLIFYSGDPNSDGRILNIDTSVVSVYENGADLFPVIIGKGALYANSGTGVRIYDINPLVSDVATFGAVTTTKTNTSDLIVANDVSVGNISYLGGGFRADADSLIDGDFKVDGVICGTQYEVGTDPLLDDANVRTTTTWSSDKINTELATKSSLDNLNITGFGTYTDIDAFTDGAQSQIHVRSSVYAGNFLYLCNVKFGNGQVSVNVIDLEQKKEVGGVILNTSGGANASPMILRANTLIISSNGTGNRGDIYFVDITDPYNLTFTTLNVVDDIKDIQTYSRYLYVAKTTTVEVFDLYLPTPTLVSTYTLQRSVGLFTIIGDYLVSLAYNRDNLKKFDFEVISLANPASLTHVGNSAFLKDETNTADVIYSTDGTTGGGAFVSGPYGYPAIRFDVVQNVMYLTHYRRLFKIDLDNLLAPKLLIAPVDVPYSGAGTLNTNGGMTVFGNRILIGTWQFPATTTSDKRISLYDTDLNLIDQQLTNATNQGVGAVGDFLYTLVAWKGNTIYPYVRVYDTNLETLNNMKMGSFKSTDGIIQRDLFVDKNLNVKGNTVLGNGFISQDDSLVDGDFKVDGVICGTQALDVQGKTVDFNTATNNHVLTYNSGTSTWEPANAQAVNPFNQSLNTTDTVSFNQASANLITGVTGLRLGAGARLESSVAGTDGGITFNADDSVRFLTGAKPIQSEYIFGDASMTTPSSTNTFGGKVVNFGTSTDNSVLTYSGGNWNPTTLPTVYGLTLDPATAINTTLTLQKNGASTNNHIQLKNESGVTKWFISHIGSDLFRISASGGGGTSLEINHATGKVIIPNDLEVLGTTTSINSTDITLDDRCVIANFDSTNDPLHVPADAKNTYMFQHNNGANSTAIYSGLCRRGDLSSKQFQLFKDASLDVNGCPTITTYGDMRVEQLELNDIKVTTGSLTKWTNFRSSQIAQEDDVTVNIGDSYPVAHTVPSLGSWDVIPDVGDGNSNVFSIVSTSVTMNATTYTVPMVDVDDSQLPSTNIKYSYNIGLLGEANDFALRMYRYIISSGQVFNVGTPVYFNSDNAFPVPISQTRIIEHQAGQRYFLVITSDVSKKIKRKLLLNMQWSTVL